MSRADNEVTRRVTRSDVARYAGVSTAVVSYVLNSGPRPVAEATAARVREAMDILQYRPNLSARTLRAGTSQAIGLVVADSLNPYFNELTRALERAAAARGHRLLVVDSEGSHEAEVDLVEELLDRQVGGLILISASLRHDPIAGVRSFGIPVVLLDCPGPVHGRMTVGPAAQEAGVSLVRHLIGTHGYTDVGLVIGSGGGFGSPDPRERGWESALLAEGIRLGPVQRVDWSREGGYEAGRQFLNTTLPRAIFASSDAQALGLLLALHEAGVRIPEEVAVVSFDGTAESEFCWPPLTVAKQPAHQMARIAIGLVEQPEANPAHHVFPTELIVRSSCGCPPQRRTPSDTHLRDR